MQAIIGRLTSKKSKAVQVPSIHGELHAHTSAYLKPQITPSIGIIPPQSFGPTHSTAPAARRNSAVSPLSSFSHSGLYTYFSVTLAPSNPSSVLDITRTHEACVFFSGEME